MNYILVCHDCEWLPSRFKPEGCITIPFRFDLELSNAGKWKNIHRTLLHIAPLKQDSLFWFPDPDLEFADTLPEQLFQSMRHYGIGLCQPSLTVDSVASHPFLITNGSTVPRRVEFCEIMCPAFDLPTLRRNLWTFDLNYSGFGIDFLWGKKEPCHVLDWLQVRHPSSPGYPLTARKAGFPNPMLELEEVRRRYL